MVIEHALLPVRPELSAAFEAAFAQAVALIRASPGCLGVRLSRCLEDESQYLLLVEWRSVEDHEVGFRGSAAYSEWRALLHRFYDPFPVVQHFAPVALPE